MSFSTSACKHFSAEHLNKSAKRENMHFPYMIFKIEVLEIARVSLNKILPYPWMWVWLEMCQKPFLQDLKKNFHSISYGSRQSPISTRYPEM